MHKHYCRHYANFLDSPTPEMLLRVSIGVLCLAAIALAQNATVMPDDDLMVRFDGELATMLRRRHFYVSLHLILAINQFLRLASI
jgi:hypothetical protein